MEMPGGLVQVPVPIGELIDKITILEIKSKRISDDGMLVNIRRELDELIAVRDREIEITEELERLTAELKEVNEALWVIEDAIRVCERNKDFGPRFIDLARSVYHRNDHRSRIKRKINELLGSRLLEEKAYIQYSA